VSSHGYIPLVKEHVRRIPVGREVTVLEVGIDRGTMLFPIVAHLARTRESFLFVGVDVAVQEQVLVVLSNLDLTPAQRVALVEGNSMKALPRLVEQGMSFDVVLIDGDHNYHTVSSELEHLGSLANHGSLVIVDDYGGRWSDRDLWYSERPGYEANEHVTARVETQKHGVKAAVDDWLTAHPEWTGTQPLKGEPIVLTRQHSQRS